MLLKVILGVLVYFCKILKKKTNKNNKPTQNPLNPNSVHQEVISLAIALCDLL